MKLKSKYNIGDLVEYVDDLSLGYDIGRIISVNIFFSWETSQITTYNVRPAMDKSYLYDNCQEIKENNITKVLNKRAFEREYAKQYAKIQINKSGEEDVKNKR